MKKVNLLIAMILGGLQFCYSQAGKVDSTFGTNGIVRASIDYFYLNVENWRQVLLSADGSMYVIFDVGSTTFISKRFSNGSVDSTYGTDGLSVPLPIEPYPLSVAALQPGGKIVRVVNNHIYRYNTDGTLDNTFGTNGKQQTDFGNSLALQNDGKIVVSGAGIARYNGDGSADNTFGKGGKIVTDLGVDLIAIQNDGKIIAASGNALARYNSDGSTDSTFVSEGPANFNVTAVVLQKDGKILVAGWGQDFAIIRYNTDGSPDKTFNGNGEVITDFGSVYDQLFSLALDNDGKIVVAGQTVSPDLVPLLALGRYNPNGTLDSSFSGDGKQTLEDDYLSGTAPVVIQSNNKILVGIHSSIARFDSDGSLDRSFGENGKLEYTIPYANTSFSKAVVQKDGKIVVVGSGISAIDTAAHYVVVRYNTDGSLDSTFAGDGKLITNFGLDSYYPSIAVQPDGKIVVAGSGSNGSAPPSNENEIDFVVVRYHTDGSIDNSFSEDGKQITDFGFADVVSSVAIQNDGKIVVTGTTNSIVNSQRHTDIALARYNTDGSLDYSFGNRGKQVTKIAKGGVSSMAIQNDGKIVLCGTKNVGESASFAVLRYNTDGSLDNSFAEAGIQITRFGQRDFGRGLAIQNDGKIVIAGDMLINNKYSSAIIRYNTNGSLDSSFSNDGKLKAFASAIAVQNDGKIVLGGGGSGLVITRINTDGSPDSSFSKDGTIVTHISEFGTSVPDITISGNTLYAVTTIQSLGSNGVITRYLLNSKGTTPPTVTLTAPTNNATYLAPAAHIKLSANASVADGSITKVEFYNGNTLLHTETVIPYGFVWRNVPLGNYTLTAKAYNNSGLSTTSAPVHISVVPNKPPVVSIIKPSNNEVFGAPAYIHFEANAKDVDGRITRVEFYNGTTLLNTQYQYPYAFVWKDVPAGTYTITAVATDNWGEQTTSEAVEVRVISPGMMVQSDRPSNSKKSISDVVGLQLAPNPATNMVNIYTIGWQQIKSATISVISASGVVVKTMQLNSLAKPIRLDVSSLLSGVYTVKFISGAKVTYRQFVKL